MSRLTRLVTSKPAQTSSAAALKIPTMPKRVITLSRVASRQAPHDNAPPTMEKTCGLFDFIEPNVSTESNSRLTPENLLFLDPLLSSTAYNIKVDKSELDMEANINIFDTFFTFDIDQSNITPSLLQQQSINQEPMETKKKTFAQKLEEVRINNFTPYIRNIITKLLFSFKANLNIKIVKSDPEEENLGTPMNLDMDDTDIAKLLTPNTEQMCLQFLHSIPTDSAVTSQQQPSARIATEDQLLSSIGLTNDELENLVSGVHQNQAEPSDHAYSNKRPLEDDDETMSNFDPNTPTTSSSLLTPKKKQRARGIYRAEDVTNEDDLANYLERRVKNNISSKISRANKKSYYMEMDAKSAAIEAENRRLEIKLQKLEKLNQIMKDYLKDAFVGNLK